MILQPEKDQAFLIPCNTLVLNSEALLGPHLLQLEKFPHVLGMVLCGLSSWSLPCERENDPQAATVEDKLLG